MAADVAAFRQKMQNDHGTSPTQSDKSAYFTVKDAANHVGVSIYTIYRWFNSGLPHVRIHSDKKLKPLIRIPKKDFLAWIKQNEEQHAPADDRLRP